MFPFGRSIQPALPENFLFGVACSDHQCEAYDARYEDIYDQFEREHQRTPRCHATDFYKRYSEDIALAQKMGCRAFRFSVSWARVEPARGQFNLEALNHYAQLAAAVRQAGMEPVVTLLHFVWPLHVQDRDGLLNSEFPSWFAAYVKQVHTALRPYVRFWLTFNEPNNLIFGYLKPWFLSDYKAPPGLPSDFGMQQQLSFAALLIQRVLQGHQAAYSMIKETDGDRAALVSANTYNFGLPTRLFGLPLSLQAAIDNNLKRARRLEDYESWWRRLGTSLVERPFLRRSDVDLIAASLTVTPARTELIDFSDVYFVVSQAILVKASSSFQGLGDLAGARIGVAQGSTASDQVQKMIVGARIVSFATYTEALGALIATEIEGIASDEAILDRLTCLQAEQFRIIAGLSGQQAYALGVTQGNRELLAIVNRALQWVKDSGLWAKLYERYFGTPVPEPPPGQLGQALEAKRVSVPHAQTHLECGKEPIPERTSLPVAAKGTLLAKMQQSQRLVVGVRSDAPPFGYTNAKTGQLEGFDVDLARAICTYILGNDTQVSFKVITSDQRIPLLRTALAWLDPLAQSWTALSTFVTANWFQMAELGRLPSYLCPPDCKPISDYVCFDYYYGVRSLTPWRVGELLNVVKQDFLHSPVWPAGLYDTLKYLHDLFPKKPILIAENGWVDTPDGARKAAYIDQHVAQVQRAVASGVNVIGYLVWSMTSNREWGLPFNANSDFGLYHVALDADPALKRQPTAAVQRYTEIIRRRGSSLPV